MHDACPSCGHFVDVTAGQLTSCPGCGHWWIVGGDEAKKAARQAAPAAAPIAEIEDDGDDEADHPSGPSASAQAAHAAAGGAGRPEGTPPIAGMRTAVAARPAPEPAGGPFEYEVQYAAGDQWQGPFDRYGLREMLYVGRLTGDEQVRVPGASTHERLGDLAEFEEVLALLGHKEQTGAHRHSIVGWKKQKKQAAPAPAAAPAEVPRAQGAPAASGPSPDVAADAAQGAPDASAAAAPPVSSAQPAPSGGPPKALLVVGGLVLLAAVAAAAAFALS